MNERNSILSRMFLVLGLFLLIPCVLAFQLFRLNYISGTELRDLWSRQTLETIPIHSQRGKIYDANGTLLATNAASYKIALDPKTEGLTRDQINQLVKTLSEVTATSPSVYREKIASAPVRSRYVKLADNLTPIGRDEIRKLDIRGVIIEESFRRVYTFGSLAAHILGYVDYNLEGRAGVESFYNKALSGEDGIQIVQRDPRNRISAFVGAPKKLPVDGNNLHTTIDSYIQAILEDELKRGVERASASYGSGIIIEVKTGAVKAMANYPSFDPNFPGRTENRYRRNVAIADMIEPGSTYKLVTAIAAVEQNAVDFDEIFKTPANGAVQIHGLTLKDHVPLGSLDFQQVIQKSSNVAIAEIAMRLKPDTFYQYSRNLGFGSPTHIDLTGEADGLLKKPYDWTKVSLPWMAHGYEVLVTPLQIAQAYAAFANGGELMQPYVLDYIEDNNGKTVYKNKPAAVRKIADKKTIEKLLPVFESVVNDEGTGNLAQIDGLRIAGKTGTSKKVVSGSYANEYVATFVGFFPVEDPKYVTLIVLNEPETSIYGGVVSAPVFRETSKRIAALDNSIQKNLHPDNAQRPAIAAVPALKGLGHHAAEVILKELNLPYKLIGKGGVVASQSPEAGTRIEPHEKLELTLSGNTAEAADTESGNRELAVVPQLIGMNMRAANKVLNDLGFNAQFIGSGTIYAQYPEAGSRLRTDQAVIIRGRAKSLELISKAGT